MKFKPSDRFCLSDEVLSQEVNGETVLLDLEGDSYFALNEVGTRIWQLFQLEKTLVEILDALSDEYDVGRGQLEVEVDGLLGQLTGAGLVNLLDDWSLPNFRYQPGL